MLQNVHEIALFRQATAGGGKTFRAIGMDEKSFEELVKASAFHHPACTAMDLGSRISRKQEFAPIVAVSLDEKGRWFSLLSSCYRRLLT